MPYPFGALSLDDAPHEIPSGDMYWIPKGSDVGLLLGNARDVTRELTSEEIEEEDRRTGDRYLQATYQTQKRGKITAQLVQQTDFSLNAADGADGTDDLVQVAAEEKVRTFASAIVNGVYECKDAETRFQYRDVTDVTVTDSAGTSTYEAGKHYHLNAKAGTVTLVAKPAAAGAGLKLTWSAPAATRKARRQHSSKIGQEGSLRIVQDNTAGENFDFWHPVCRAKMSGGRKIIAESQELTVYEIEITLFPDPSAEPGWEFGYAVPLDAPAAA